MAEKPPEEEIEEDNEVHSDDDEDDLQKPAWVGYFRLPKADVELEHPFLPTDEFLPDAAKRKAKVNPAAAEMYSGWWTRRKVTGEALGSKIRVLIKPVGFLSEREARILSIIAGNDENAARYNVTRFYGAVLYPPTAEYRVVLEYCDRGYLRDYVLNLKNHFDPEDFAKQIANGMRYLHYGAPYHPIIHRNLHPLSVLLKSNGDKIVLKLHGFQHAKIMAEHETFGGQTVAPTNPGLWLGPELNLGKTTTDLASDVYSFGMVVWHLFSRKLPFDGKRMTEPQIMTLTGTKKQRPAMPPTPECPQFWVTLIDKCWQDETTERPDFIKIVKAMNQKKEPLLDPHKPLPEAMLAEDQAEKDKRESWELDPDHRPTEGDQILSSNKSTSTVVTAWFEDGGKKGKKGPEPTLALKKPIKLSTEAPTRAQFKSFMETAQKISHPHILSCDGVILLESIQMPIMELSVRQYMKGKRIKDSANRRKTVFKGFGSMRDTQVIHVMRCVLDGLHYLHTTVDIAHGGLSTSNVLINIKGKKEWEVKLSDYNIAALGIESHSHNKFCGGAPSSVEGSPRGDLYSCSIMLVEMATGKDHNVGEKKKKKDWENARSEVKKKDPKIWKAVAHCEDLSKHAELTARNVLGFL